ncbi:hypothetical protein THASP1DRAFT_29384 [Thamnocephalis sphaerospora]|uniref:Uncharacterized protein n=1 Tax=Thamnocephalis sphaerospora TaxID=78915 RepID=A0A4P9XS90_9FUNG|nr:hypothetical protein THASP1DRAFT_29384 [Thamnocephalis sphaerospora]|eukprot:RKP08832.1 hypothetical protein THASP1DRAFT_29384 [Thamnocephalis sphaerospora]
MSWSFFSLFLCCLAAITNMLLTPINPIPIVISTVVQQVLGFAFYGPFFGKYWLATMEKDKGSPRWMEESQFSLISVLGSEVIFSYARAHAIALILAAMKVDSPEAAALTAFYIFAGITLPQIVSDANWEARPALLPVIKSLRLGLVTLFICEICVLWPAY